MKIENPQQQMLPRSDQDWKQLMTDGSRFRAPRATFEDAQDMLRRAAAQLNVGDQSEEESRDRVAILREEFVRMAYEKAITYDYPISDETKLEYEMISPKKLAKLEFRLSLTPARLAARYIAWLHDSLGTEAPNPLAGWLRELGAEIGKRYPWHNPHRIILGAEREVFALVGMYVSALLAWIEDFSAALLLDVTVTACSTFGSRLSPDLSARLVDQRQQLQVWPIVLKIIEDDHFRESVLPAAMRAALDCDQLSAIAFGRSAPESEAAELAAKAQSCVKTLFANACASASKFLCHQQFLSLAEVNLNFGNRRRDYELAVKVLEQARTHVAPVKTAAKSAASTKQQRKVTKAATSAATLATQLDKDKLLG